MSDPVVVIGGGITGLAAAHELQQQGREFLLLEASSRVGGKIDGGPVGGLVIDSAADGFLARQPEMTDLVVEIGLGDNLVKPSGGQAFIWANGALRAIPSPSVLGVPLDTDAVAASGIVSDSGVADLQRGFDSMHQALVADATVGEVLRPIIGSEVFERLVDPLLGGINAGSADLMSIRAGAPQLAAAASLGGDMRANLAAQESDSAKHPGTVFLGVSGGSIRIIERLRQRLGTAIRTDSPATSMERRAGGWVVDTPTGPLKAARVVLATPAAVTARLVERYCPQAASMLRGIPYSSAVLVTLVVDRDRIAHPLDGSGFLVPRDQGLLMTACSWTSSKWRHYDDGKHAVLRVSAGRSDDPRWLALHPEEIVTQLTDELAETIGLDCKPVARVTQWRESLPQYAPGHLDRITAVEDEIAAEAPGVVATGAAFRGLGLPACVRQGRAAARW